MADASLAEDLFQRFKSRPTSSMRPGLNLHVEELLERVKDPDYPADDLARTMVGLVHNITIRIEPYLNAPLGVEEVKIIDPRLHTVAQQLLEILATQVLPGAVLLAMEKTTVDRHPGG